MKNLSDTDINKFSNKFESYISAQNTIGYAWLQVYENGKYVAQLAYVTVSISFRKNLFKNKCGFKSTFYR